MAITYKVLKCKNPRGQAGVLYANDRAVKTGDYTFDQLTEDIQFSTTVTKADVVAVLAAAQEYILKGLLSGQRVVLSDLGALQVQLKSHCFAQSAIGGDDFDPSSYIKNYYVRFRPEARLIKALRSQARVRRLSSTLMP
ncbi:MAG: HU family DNA-binding protein [Bacteroidaceae bacterium]|nr:HU family DNA-binding protein [Bacteroidaceae bacterium]